MQNHREPLDALCECGHTNLDHVGSDPSIKADFTSCFKCTCLSFECPKPEEK